MYILGQEERKLSIKNKIQEQINEKVKNPEIDDEIEITSLSDINADDILTGDFIKTFLTQEEAELYNKRKERYLEDFELNDSSDEILLQNLLLMEIQRVRLIRKFLEKPSPKIEAELQKCIDSIVNYQERMGMLRKQRMNKKDEINNSFADLVQQFEKERIQKIIEKNKQEEEEKLKQRKERTEYIGNSYEKSVKYFDEVFLPKVQPIKEGKEDNEINEAENNGDSEEIT